MTKTRTLYHVTHRRNLAGILANGLTPKRARTRWQTLWYTNADGVAWAIRHVMERHGYQSPSVLVVIEVEIPHKLIKRNRWSAIYHSTATVAVRREMIRNATDYLQE